MQNRRHFLQALTLPALASPAWAQQTNYPTRSVRMVVPWPAGGNGDQLGRMLAMSLTENLRQSFVVENLAGAGGSVAIASVAKAPPDGYTFVQVTAAATINATLNPNLAFDLRKDFAPIGLAGDLPLILVVHPSLPVNSVKELIAYAKANPGKLNYGSSGVGTGGHLAAELFKHLAGLDILHVPYKGAAFGMTDLIAGRTQLYFDGIPSAMRHVTSGRLKLLAVTTPKRFSGLPDVPTMIEAGVPGLMASVWFGFMAPAGTPPAIINKLHAEMNKVLDTPQAKAKLLEIGFEPVRSASPQEFTSFISEEIDRWGKVIKSAGIKAD